MDMLSKVIESCKDLATRLSSRRVDIQSLTGYEELVDEPLTLFFLLKDALKGVCRFIDEWVGEHEGCRDVEVLMFKCTHAHDRHVERLKRFAIKFGCHTVVLEVLEEVKKDIQP